MERRELLGLGVAGLATLAGCSDESPAIVGNNGTDGGGDGDVVYQGSNRETIDPGRFVPFRFELELPATLSYNLRVVEGPNVDIIATDPGNAEKFEQGGNWQLYTPASRSDVGAASVTAGLDPGEWVVIVDNSFVGEARPKPTPTTRPAGAPPPTPTPTPTGVPGDPTTVQFDYRIFR